MNRPPMKTLRAGLIGVLLAPALGAAEAKPGTAAQKLSFNEHIQPILARRAQPQRVVR